MANSHWLHHQTALKEQFKQQIKSYGNQSFSDYWKSDEKKLYKKEVGRTIDAYNIMCE